MGILDKILGFDKLDNEINDGLNLHIRNLTRILEKVNDWEIRQLLDQVRRYKRMSKDGRTRHLDEMIRFNYKVGNKIQKYRYIWDRN